MSPYRPAPRYNEGRERDRYVHSTETTQRKVDQSEITALGNAAARCLWPVKNFSFDLCLNRTENSPGLILLFFDLLLGQQTNLNEILHEIGRFYINGTFFYFFLSIVEFNLFWHAPVFQTGLGNILENKSSEFSNFLFSGVAPLWVEAVTGAQCPRQKLIESPQNPTPLRVLAVCRGYAHSYMSPT